jgi:hypothetical protein
METQHILGTSPVSAKPLHGWRVFTAPRGRAWVLNFLAAFEPSYNSPFLSINDEYRPQYAKSRQFNSYLCRTPYSLPYIPFNEEKNTTFSKQELLNKDKNDQMLHVLHLF